MGLAGLPGQDHDIITSEASLPVGPHLVGRGEMDQYAKKKCLVDPFRVPATGVMERKRLEYQVLQETIEE